MKYPKTYKASCPFCKEEVVSERQGTGKMFSGKKDYWYSSNHSCAKGKEASNTLKQLSNIISK